MQARCDALFVITPSATARGVIERGCPARTKKCLRSPQQPTPSEREARSDQGRGVSTATFCSRYTERDGAKVLTSGGGAPRELGKVRGALSNRLRASAKREAIKIAA